MASRFSRIGLILKSSVLPLVLASVVAAPIAYVGEAAAADRSYREIARDIVRDQERSDRSLRVGTKGDVYLSSAAVVASFVALIVPPAGATLMGGIAAGSIVLGVGTAAVGLGRWLYLDARATRQKAALVTLVGRTEAQRLIEEARREHTERTARAALGLNVSRNAPTTPTAPVTGAQPLSSVGAGAGTVR